MFSAAGRKSAESDDGVGLDGNSVHVDLDFDGEVEVDGELIVPAPAGAGVSARSGVTRVGRALVVASRSVGRRRRVAVAALGGVSSGRRRLVCSRSKVTVLGSRRLAPPGILAVVCTVLIGLAELAVLAVLPGLPVGRHRCAGVVVAVSPARSVLRSRAAEERERGEDSLEDRAQNLEKVILVMADEDNEEYCLPGSGKARR